MYQTRKEVENWLIEMNIKNYVINEDLTVNVNNSVDISFKELKEIPIQFGIITGSFNCNYNKLSNLKGCPNKVYNNFNCNNNKLTSLECCPEVINGNFNCYNNSLISLEKCPEIVNGDFNCSNNYLTSLEGFPKEITGEYINVKINNIKEEELVNFHCEMKNINKIYSDFNEDGNKEEFLEKVRFYKNIKEENELLKELSVNSNIKLNKKL